MREMKDSGVEWIGEIPTTWQLSKIGSIYDERNEKVSDKNYEPLSVTKQGIVPQLETAAKTDNGDNRKLIKKNDFVINSRSDRRGSCGISEYDGSCSLINTVLRPRRNMCNMYYGFVFKSENFADEYYRWGHGIVNDLWSTKWSDMKNIYIPMPSIEEQKKMAEYLDSKCSKIDAIIEKQQTIIEKLKEYKLSLITETVTKGLNNDVEMKDSGNEWIGKVPNEWNVLKFGRCVTIKSNLVPPEKYMDFPQVAPDEIEKGSGKLVGYKSVEESGVISWNHLFYKGQIIYSKIRPLLDKVIIAPFDGLCSADMYPMETDNNSKFIVYMILSDYFHSQVALCTENRVKMPKINQNELSNIVVVLPSIDEQNSIVSFLDAKCDAIDKTIMDRERAIEKLQEYKKSLIYEVVTGKKEV